jgi:hypothetical protein
MEGQRRRSLETVGGDKRPVRRTRPRSRRAADKTQVPNPNTFACEEQHRRRHPKRQGGSGDREHETPETSRGLVVREQALRTGSIFEG